jgi:hypothetical protein
MYSSVFDMEPPYHASVLHFKYTRKQNKQRSFHNSFKKQPNLNFESNAATKQGPTR